MAISLVLSAAAPRADAQLRLLDWLQYADLNGDHIVDVADLNKAIGKGGNERAAEDIAIHMLAPSGKLRLLAIGNSYTADALAYLPYILQQVAPDIDVTIGICYKSGSTLQNHYEKGIVEHAPYEIYYKWKNGGPWCDAHDHWSFGLSYVFGNEPWDVVLLQQGSTQSYDYKNYQPYLDYIID